MSLQLVTLGVYGTTAESFFGALREVGADAFIDLRARRGLRGSKYSYANATKLQATLASMGIAYMHRPDLAPSNSIRALQHSADEGAGIEKRQRGELSAAFRDAYQREVLAAVDLEAFSAALGQYKLPALFCVEAPPQACHRGILAEHLEKVGWEVHHWSPNASSS